MYRSGTIKSGLTVKVVYNVTSYTVKLELPGRSMDLQVKNKFKFSGLTLFNSIVRVTATLATFLASVLPA